MLVNTCVVAFCATPTSLQSLVAHLGSIKLQLKKKIADWSEGLIGECVDVRSGWLSEGRWMFGGGGGGGSVC